MNKAKSILLSRVRLSLFLIISILIVIGLIGLYIGRTQNFALRRHFSEVVARMLANTTAEESKIIFKKISETQNSMGLLKMDTWIIDQQGNIQYNGLNHPYPFKWEKTPKPLEPYKFEIFESESTLLASIGVTKIPGEMPLYLVVGKHHDTQEVYPLIAIVVVVIFSIIVISILITVGTFSFYFRSKNDEAIRIIQDLKNGNMSARFKITTLDEVGLLMERFNEMADQIEHVVRNLRTAEKARVELLKELTHDVQTPLTSLRTLNETLSDYHHQMEKEKVDQCFNLVKAEITYMERLIRDLLTLAQLSDPKYQLTLEQVNIQEILKVEVAPFESRYPNVKVVFENCNKPVMVSGDTLLLRRLIRNACSNSFRFARSEIKIRLEEVENKVKLLIVDDGPGLSSEELNQFGKKKFSRIFSQEEGGQIYLGLGSVIMKEIAYLHQGEVQVNNNSGTYGAQVTIILSK